MFSATTARLRCGRPTLRPVSSMGRVNSYFRSRLNSFLAGTASHSPPLAFVLDIDGVLIRGKHPVPTAQRALSILDGNNPFNSKIPFILLTNGGGVGEEERCRRLTKILGFPISLSQYVQAHTIIKTVSSELRNKNVLVLGGKGDVIRKVAESYGLEKAYTTLDILAWNPSVWPFHTLTPEERKSTETAKEIDFSTSPIEAVIVFHDPRNWALDVQVLCDVVQSGGFIGGPYLEIEQQLENPIPLIFCNPDLLWRSDFEQVRLGQGAFKTAFQAIYKSLTGSEYPHTQYGKPTLATSAFAEKVLRSYMQEIYGASSDPLPPIYMIGDNPASDIAGANNAGWSSVLVETGVYNPKHGPPESLPTYQAENVEEAVKWAIDREIRRKYSS